MRSAVKATIVAAGILCAFPLALLSGFGRVRVVYQTFATALSLLPGLPGDYVRIAWYWMTLESCSLYSRISFGSFVAQRESEIGRGVYIGSYCVLGRCRIGDRTQIASLVQVLSGARQHGRDEQGRILGAEEGEFRKVSIGADCWIGASAIVMADVGAGSTVGAGAVVTRPVPSGVVAVGNPARVLRRIGEAARQEGAGE